MWQIRFEGFETEQDADKFSAALKNSIFYKKRARQHEMQTDNTTIIFRFKSEDGWQKISQACSQNLRRLGLLLLQNNGAATTALAAVAHTAAKSTTVSSFFRK